MRTPRLERHIEELCNRSRVLHETYNAARVTMRESRALVARSRGKPYLATEGGRPIIREDDESGFGDVHRGRVAAKI
jgi:hypothetical protein